MEEKEEKDMFEKKQLFYVDKNCKPIQSMCSGEYCKMDEIKLDANMLPEFHFDELVRF